MSFSIRAVRVQYHQGLAFRFFDRTACFVPTETVSIWLGIAFSDTPSFTAALPTFPCVRVLVGWDQRAAVLTATAAPGTSVESRRVSRLRHGREVT